MARLSQSTGTPWWTATWGPVVLRIVVGVVFTAHGAQKFGRGFGSIAEMMANIGIPLPTAAAIVVTLVEFFGGLALIAGVGTRIAAALLVIDMAVAIAMVHAPKGFFAPSGMEFPLTLLAANLTLAL